MNPATWLLVWAGMADWPGIVDQSTEELPRHPSAHSVFFGEVGGDRLALLLVDYTEGEMALVRDQLAHSWSFGFVNLVDDVAGEDV